jgi:hypothetical protein
VASLGRRIEALEALTPRREVVTIVRFFSAGAEAAEPTGFRTIDGAQRWEREPGETAEELVERASREGHRNAWGVAVIVEEQGW